MANNNADIEAIVDGDRKIIAILSFSQTLMFLVIYVALVFWVMRSIKPMKLERSANVTICTFMFCSILILSVQTVYMSFSLYQRSNKSDEKVERLLEICQVITMNLNNFVLMFYTYQLRIVHIKLSSQNSAEFFKRIRSTNMIWIVLFVEQILYICVAIVDIYITNEIIKLVQIPFSVLTESYLMYLQFFYFAFILRKKNEMYRIQRSQWTCIGKTLFVWLFIVLVINSINFIMLEIWNII